MARFYGWVGFARTAETDPENHPGKWDVVLVERPYYGDVMRNSRRWDQNGSGINDNLVLNNTISFLADDFANKNIGIMKYVRWRGERWQITNIEIQRPRLILTIGGLYNGPEPSQTASYA